MDAPDNTTAPEHRGRQAEEMNPSAGYIRAYPDTGSTAKPARQRRGNAATRVIAYVDGFNLYHGLRARFQHRYLWLDLVGLVRRLRPRDTIVAVRYFTALVRNQPQAEARQQVYLAALGAHSGPLLGIVQGRYQAKQQECRGCGVRWISYEEKETDVNIAVSLVADAASSAADLALLVSADSDLCPAIRTTRVVSAAVGGGMGIVAAFPPRRYSHEIKTLVPGAFTLAQADIRNSLLPEVVVDPRSGQKYRRPTKWH
jgi:uncharacterized LabA/DUF88 family protein